MTQEKKQAVTTEKKEGIGWVIFDYPPVNVFDATNMPQVAKALKDMNADPEVKVVVFTNAGDRAFSAGMSIQQHDPNIGGEGLGAGEHAITEAGWNMEKPLIAAINGYCLGGSIEFILSCDMVVASETSTFGHPEIKVGQPGGDNAVPQVLGKFRAMEFLLSGDRITAQQAEQWGLCNKVLPKENFREEVEKFAKKFTVNSGIILSIRRKTIAAMMRDLGKISEEAQRETRELMPKIRETEDWREGIKAFMEKRPPQWKNR